MTSEDDQKFLHDVVFGNDGSVFKTLDESIPSIRENVEAVTKYLANICDYAHDRDCVGYSKAHTDKGHFIASHGIGAYPHREDRHSFYYVNYATKKISMDSEHLRMWIRVLYKYRGQIGGNFYSRIFW